MRIGMLGTYPPTECGLATFAAALRSGMCDGDVDQQACAIVRLVDQADDRTGLLVDVPVAHAGAQGSGEGGQPALGGGVGAEHPDAHPLSRAG